MRKYFFILTQLILILFISSCANLIKFRSGKSDLSYLKETNKVKIIFDYRDMAVGKYPNDSLYVADKVKRLNQKEPGEGDKWKEKWYGKRKYILETDFISILNDYSEDTGLRFNRSYENTRYTLVLKTWFLEPGFDGFIVSKKAEIDTEILFYKGENMSEPLTTLDAIDIKSAGRGGGGVHYTSHGPGGTVPVYHGSNSGEITGRIEGAYENCARELADYLIKQLK